MKGFHMKAVWVTGLAAVAVAAAPAAAMLLGSAPATAATPTSVELIEAPVVATVAEPTPTTGIDPVVRRATTVSEAEAPAGKVSQSGGDADAKCIVKWWKPQLLKTHSYKPVAFQQSKLICNDVAGTSEIILEQNDQLVVAGTVVNNQTNVTFNALTLIPNDEQWEDAFCTGIGRSSGGSFGVVAQECAPLKDFGRMKPTFQGGR